MTGGMNAVLALFAWEWINIAIEFTAVAWTRLPHLFLAVVGVNLLTHPVFMLVRPALGDETSAIICCEIVIALVEWTCLAAMYGWSRFRLCGAMAFTMNAASYITGLLLL